MRLYFDGNHSARHNPGCCSVVLLMLFSSFVAAQTATPVYIDASQCRNIPVDLVRVACYDSLADRAQAGQQPASTQALPAPVTSDNAVNRQLQEQNRQMREELARLRKGTQEETDDDNSGWLGLGRQRSGSADEDREELSNRIKSLQQTPNGWIVTLENGQVWKQMGNKTYRLRKGQEVLITSSRWGNSYRLTASGLDNFIQVERIR